METLFGVGRTVLPSIGHYEALSAVVRQLILLFPFFLWLAVPPEGTDTADLLRVMVVAWLAYSMLVLFEVRFSPQLHNWLYGYFPSDFVQEVRDGGIVPWCLWDTAF